MSREWQDVKGMQLWQFCSACFIWRSKDAFGWLSGQHHSKEGLGSTPAHCGSETFAWSVGMRSAHTDCCATHTATVVLLSLDSKHLNGPLWEAKTHLMCAGTLSCTSVCMQGWSKPCLLAPAAASDNGAIVCLGCGALDRWLPFDTHVVCRGKRGPNCGGADTAYTIQAAMGICSGLAVVCWDGIGWEPCLVMRLQAMYTAATGDGRSLVVQQPMTAGSPSGGWHRHQAPGSVHCRDMWRCRIAMVPEAMVGIATTTDTVHHPRVVCGCPYIGIVLLWCCSGHSVDRDTRMPLLPAFMAVF